MYHVFRQENSVAFSGYPFGLIQACFYVCHINTEAQCLLKWAILLLLRP